MLNNREIIFLKTLRQPDSENDIIMTHYISHVGFLLFSQNWIFSCTINHVLLYKNVLFVRIR